MSIESRHISEQIDRSAEEVYAFASDPANIPHWAPGLGTSIEQVDGRWFVETPGGRVEVAFAERNPFGVVDHVVTLPSGEAFSNPMRVVPLGAGSEITFTLRRQPGMSDDDFERDEALVRADLRRLKQLLER